MKKYDLQEMHLIEIQLKHATFLNVTDNIKKYLIHAEDRFGNEVVGYKKLGKIRVFKYDKEEVDD